MAKTRPPYIPEFRRQMVELRENRQLRLERDILSKAAAWFARETNTIPSKGSGVSRKSGRIPDGGWPRLCRFIRAHLCIKRTLCFITASG
jgi:hypothetical protein